MTTRDTGVHPALRSSPAFSTIGAGDALPDLVVDMTATLIAAGAIATRDFMPVHHDRAYANSQGAPDIFMNILSDTAYCSRFLTDWAGPDAMLRRLAVRLGVPVFPGDRLVYSGEVTGVATERDEGLVEIGFRATTPLGDHVTGTATVALPVRG
jgi:acyl dehydratase